MRDVIERLEFAARCTSCRFAKWCGYAPIVAELAATRHLRRCPTHTVEVWRGDTRIGVRVSGIEVLDSGAEPPF